jgi:hypothetical protein
MNRLIKLVLFRKWKKAYYWLFGVRLWFYEFQGDYDKLYRMREEPIEYQPK